MFVCSKHLNIFSVVNLVFILIDKKVRTISDLVAPEGKPLPLFDKLRLGSNAKPIGFGAR